MKDNSWSVYILRCADKSLYTGATNNLDARLIAHETGRGAKYTRSRRPVKLVWERCELTKSEALRLEFRIKQLSKVEKELLVKSSS